MKSCFSETYACLSPSPCVPATTSLPPSLPGWHTGGIDELVVIEDRLHLSIRVN